MNIEEWKDIKGYEGIYQVSNFGNIKSLYGKEHLIKPFPRPNGYLGIMLYKNGKTHPRSIHRIVAETFISNPEDKEQVNHINGIKTDNTTNNLEWCTRKENMAHSWKNGLRQFSEKRKIEMRKKMSIEVLQYDKNGKFIKEWESAKVAGKVLGISQQCISNCRAGKTKSAGGYIWKYKEIQEK